LRKRSTSANDLSSNLREDAKDALNPTCCLMPVLKSNGLRHRLLVVEPHTLLLLPLLLKPHTLLLKPHTLLLKPHALLLKTLFLEACLRLLAHHLLWDRRASDGTRRAMTHKLDSALGELARLLLNLVPRSLDARHGTID